MIMIIENMVLLPDLKARNEHSCQEIILPYSPLFLILRIFFKKEVPQIMNVTSCQNALTAPLPSMLTYQKVVEDNIEK